MRAYIYIHSNGEIVEKFEIEYEELNNLREIEEYAMKKYRGKEQYCLDIMIL